MKPYIAIPLTSNARAAVNNTPPGFYQFLVEHYSERVAALPKVKFLKQSLTEYKRIVSTCSISSYEGLLLPASTLD